MSDGKGLVREETVIDRSNSGSAFIWREKARRYPTGDAAVVPLDLSAGRVASAVFPVGSCSFKKGG